MSFVVYGAAICGLLCLTFLIYEIRNAPYYDYPDAERILSEIDRQRHELRQFG